MTENDTRLNDFASTASN